MGGPRRGRIVVLFAATQLLAALVLGELLLRVWRPHSVGVSHQPTIYEPDPVLGFRYSPGSIGHVHRLFEVDNEVRINASGFHDVDHVRSIGARDVVALGDSFTAAIQVPVEETWTQVAQRLLREHVSPTIDVFNLGLAATGTDVHLALLERHIADHPPAVVVLAFSSNDALEIQLSPVYREVRGDYVLLPANSEQAVRMRALVDRQTDDRLTRFVFDHVYLFRLAVFLTAGERNLLRQNVVGPGHVGDPVRYRSIGERRPLSHYLDGLRSLAVERDFRLLVIPIPERDDPEASLRVLRQNASELPPETVDVLPRIRAALRRNGRSYADMFWERDGHFTAFGNEMYGRVVAEVLAEELR